MNTNKPLASLSLDLDNQWSYMKTHGDPGWESFPSYFDILIPRVLHFLQELNLTITFFIVGQDAVFDKNREALGAIAAAGHEIGNHSFHHQPWLHLYTEQQIEDELARTEEHLERVTGQRPLGFRGPGFSLSTATLQVLARRGYLYDASTLPTFLGPLARAYYFMHTRTRFSAEERQRRQALFGTLRDGLRPIRPYQWQLDIGPLTEIPVTTMPIFKVPIHVSYLLYLSTFSPALALGYFNAAIRLCRWTGTQPSILLHPLDFLGQDDTPHLSFFPAMHLPSAKKLALVGDVLRTLAAHYTVVTLRQHVQMAPQTTNVLAQAPSF